MDDELILHVTVNGREFALTPERASRIARQMAARDADNPAAWAETGMLLLDFAEVAEENQ